MVDIKRSLFGEYSFFLEIFQEVIYLSYGHNSVIFMTIHQHYFIENEQILQWIAP